MAVVDILKREEKEQDQAIAHRHSFILWPRQWKKYRNSHAWQICKLSSKERVKVPSKPGIYTLLVQPGIATHPACSYLMYVGQAVSLRRRFGNYLNEKKRETGRPQILRILNKYPRHTWFCFTLVKKSQLKAVEDALMETYMPPYNKELPATIRRIVGAFSHG